MEQHLSVGTFNLVIVDIIKNPTAAERKKILAIPTIIRENRTKKEGLLVILDQQKRLPEGIGIKHNKNKNKEI